MEEKYSIIEAHADGRRMVGMRLNDFERNQSKELPWLIYIRIPLVNMNQEGLPDEAELERLNNIEDGLVKSLEKAKMAIRISHNGFREIYIQSKELSGLDSILNLYKSERLIVTIEYDPEWKVISSYYKS